MPDPKNESLLDWMKILLICGGLWDPSFTNNRLASKLFYMYSVFMKLSCLVFWLLLVGELCRLIIYQYEATIITANIAIVLSDTKIITKMMIYLKCNTLGLFKDIVEKEAEIWAGDNKEIKRLYRRKVIFLKGAMITLGVSCFMAVFFLQTKDGVVVLQHRKYNSLCNATVESHVMYQTLFPLHRNNHVYWLFASQALWTWIGLVFTPISQLILVTILLYAASRLEVLQVQFRNLVEPNFKIKATETGMNKKVMELKSLIIDYQYIIRFVNDFNQSSKYITMIEFTLSTLDMASVSASVTKAGGYGSLWLLFFIMILLTQLFLIGWTANEIAVQSARIATALYESKWYELNKEAKQLILISIIRAQRPLIITIGPMGPMTTGSILSVLKGAYSYINIMR